MGLFADDHPYSAITQWIERLTAETYEEDDLSGLPDLIEVIQLQDTGPREAARAIRKKLKYGNLHRQLRALTILNALIENAGKRFQHSFADEPLLERLRIMASDSYTDRDVKKKLTLYFLNWHKQYENEPRMRAIANLYKDLPKKPRAQPIVRPPSPHDEDEEDEQHRPGPSSPPPRPVRTSAPSSPRTDTYQSSASVSIFGHKKDKNKNKPFNLEKERPMILQTIAASGQASTNLSNALKHVNREVESVVDNPKITQYHNQCRQLRKRILLYISSIESEEWLGTLIHANEELVSALQLYERMKKPVHEDSDSEDEETYMRERMRKLSLPADDEMPPPKPARPGSTPASPQYRKPPPPPPMAAKKPVMAIEIPERKVEKSDPNDPFATPIDDDGVKWAEV